MKISFALIVLFSFSSFATARAQGVIHYDSLTVASFVTVSNDVQNRDVLKGPPDGAEVTLGSSSFIAALFAPDTTPGTPIITFQKGVQLHVYWTRLTTDSAGADIQFMAFDTAHAFLPRFGPIVKMMESGPTDVPQETTITVPDTGYNGLQITIAADSGASICWIDAIVLKQGGDLGVSESSGLTASALTAYPNPFALGTRAAIQVSSPVAGRGMLVIYDALGREVKRISVGELVAGSQAEAFVGLSHSGIYFARLFVNNAPAGSPLRLVAE